MRSLVRGLVMALMGALCMAGVAGPASAEVTGCHTEDLFIKDRGCTTGNIVDSFYGGGGGGLLYKPELLRNAEVYAAYGFSEEWIQQAQSRKITIPASTIWSGCLPLLVDSDQGLCPVDQVVGVPMSSVLRPDANGNVTITVYGDENKWIARMCGNFMIATNVENDVEKIDFQVVDAPAEITADTPATVTVRSTLRNNGSLPSAAVTDLVTISEISPDCAVNPPSRTLSRSLPRGEVVQWDAEFTITCTEPSQHQVTFENTLTGPSGYLDPNLGNNTRTVQWSPEVIGSSDLAVTDVAVQCPSSTDVGEQITCQASALVSNAGPHGGEPVAAFLELTPPEDCTFADGLDARYGAELTLAADESATIATEWTLSCANRSWHEVGVRAEAALADAADEHVVDPDASNNAAAATMRVEVFEQVDLDVAVLTLGCVDKVRGDASTCVATVEVANNGPADAVVTDVAAEFGLDGACTPTPDAGTRELTLAVGSVQALEFTTDVACGIAPGDALIVTVTAGNSAKDPHAVDTATDSLAWQPTPTSTPSTAGVELPDTGLARPGGLALTAVVLVLVGVAVVLGGRRARSITRTID